jgi:hypothetical protein
VIQSFKIILQLNEAFHFLVEALDLEVDLLGKVGDGAALDHLDDRNIILDARLQIIDFVT